MSKRPSSRTGLRRWRIVISVAIFVMVTLLWVEYSELFLRPLGWVSHIQMFPVAVGLSVSMIAFWLLVAVLFGRVYCSTVCPVGTWLDIVGHVGKKSRKGPARDYRYSPPLTRWRYISLGVFVVSMVAGITIIPVVMEPYTMYSRFVINVMKPVWGWINNELAALGNSTGWWDMYYVGHIEASIAAVILSIVTFIGISIPAWFYGRTFCNSICPVGTVLGIASSRSIWHIDIDTDLCTNCRKCEYACKASCINLNDHVIDSSRCVNCFDCIDVCPDDAIFYRPTSKQLSLPMMQRLLPPKVSAPSASASTPVTGMTDTMTKKKND
ncbi:MAG: 4Fe-4S binding protein [Candidatus Homeothermus sp.]|nr:4Fe-4S binding protein [Candidatus Homeothermus sp.]